MFDVLAFLFMKGLLLLVANIYWGLCSLSRSMEYGFRDSDHYLAGISDWELSLVNFIVSSFAVGLFMRSATTTMRDMDGNVVNSSTAAVLCYLYYQVVRFIMRAVISWRSKNLSVANDVTNLENKMTCGFVVVLAAVASAILAGKSVRNFPSAGACFMALQVGIVFAGLFVAFDCLISLQLGFVFAGIVLAALYLFLLFRI